MDVSVHPVRAYRLAQKPPLSLEDLAARIRTSEANLSRIENFKQEISNKLLPVLVAETGIPANILCPDLAKLFRAPSRPQGRRRARVRRAPSGARAAA